MGEQLSLLAAPALTHYIAKNGRIRPIGEIPARELVAAWARTKAHGDPALASALYEHVQERWG